MLVINTRANVLSTEKIGVKSPRLMNACFELAKGHGQKWLIHESK